LHLRRPRLEYTPTTSKAANQSSSTSFLPIFLKPPAYWALQEHNFILEEPEDFYRKVSPGKAENSSAKGKPGIFIEIQAQNEIGSGKLLCI